MQQPFTPTIRFPRHRWMIAIMVVLSLPLLAGRPKNKATKPGPGAPGEPAQVEDLPDDLNIASLRVHATDMIYELDLSPDQLKMLRGMAANAASDRKLTAATGDEKLATAFNDFNRALLARQDDQEIAKLRNQLTELATADEVHLDDEVVPTTTARAKAPEVAKKFTAGQIAAYLASHADQLADPVEKVLAALSDLHAADNATDADAQIKDTSEEIGQLVAGADAKKSTVVAAAVAEWFKTNRELTDEQVVTQHDSLEASAKRVVGDTPPMEILGHWMDNETAMLLSNPQLPQAIEATLAAQVQQH